MFVPMPASPFERGGLFFYTIPKPSTSAKFARVIICFQGFFLHSKKWIWPKRDLKRGQKDTSKTLPAILKTGKLFPIMDWHSIFNISTN
jgi:hypothetical protein